MLMRSDWCSGKALAWACLKSANWFSRLASSAPSLFASWVRNSVVSFARSVRCFRFSLRNSVTSSLATSLATSGFLCSNDTVKATVASPRPLTKVLSEATTMALRICSILSLSLSCLPLSANRLYLSMIRSRFSRVMTRWRMTSMRSSAKLLLFADTSSGEICCDSTKMVPVDW
ncbi:hypothetical protein D3C80_1530960 [compost metagenome]